MTTYAPGTKVFRLSALSSPNLALGNTRPSRSGQVQEVASFVGHTSESAHREGWESKFGAGNIYRLRRVGGKGKGGTTQWHESELEIVA